MEFSRHRAGIIKLQESLDPDRRGWTYHTCWENSFGGCEQYWLFQFEPKKINVTNPIWHNNCVPWRLVDVALPYCGKRVLYTVIRVMVDVFDDMPDVVTASLTICAKRSRVWLVTADELKLAPNVTAIMSCKAVVHNLLAMRRVLVEAAPVCTVSPQELYDYSSNGPYLGGDLSLSVVVTRDSTGFEVSDGKAKEKWRYGPYKSINAQALGWRNSTTAPPLKTSSDPYYLRWPTDCTTRYLVVP